MQKENVLVPGVYDKFYYRYEWVEMGKLLQDERKPM